MLSFGSLAPEFTHCLTIEIRNAPVGRPCQLRIDSGLLQEPFLVTQNAPSGRFVLNPDIPWNYDTLRQVDQLRPETFVITVTAGEKATAQTSLLCTVHSVNEAVSRVQDPVTGQWQDTSICFAAFVNEDHPWIGTLLKEAASHGSLERFSGYEFGERSVVEQIEAIWEALAARHLTYADLSTSGGVVPGIASQYVRFLDQSVRDQGANCVDASVMMASIFRRIGLRPVLFFQPGHCFVAVYDAAQGGQLIPIETTMLGSSPFTAALNYGGRELASATANLNSPGYAAVDIAVGPPGGSQADRVRGDAREPDARGHGRALGGRRPDRAPPGRGPGALGAESRRGAGETPAGRRSPCRPSWTGRPTRDRSNTRWPSPDSAPSPKILDAIVLAAVLFSGALPAVFVLGFLPRGARRRMDGRPVPPGGRRRSSRRSPFRSTYGRISGLRRGSASTGRAFASGWPTS